VLFDSIRVDMKITLNKIDASEKEMIKIPTIKM